MVERGLLARPRPPLADCTDSLHPATLLPAPRIIHATTSGCPYPQAWQRLPPLASIRGTEGAPFTQRRNEPRPPGHRGHAGKAPDARDVASPAGPNRQLSRAEPQGTVISQGAEPNKGLHPTVLPGLKRMVPSGSEQAGARDRRVRASYARPRVSTRAPKRGDTANLVGGCYGPQVS